MATQKTTSTNTDISPRQTAIAWRTARAAQQAYLAVAQGTATGDLIALKITMDDAIREALCLSGMEAAIRDRETLKTLRCTECKKPARRIRGYWGGNNPLGECADHDTRRVQG